MIISFAHIMQYTIFATVESKSPQTSPIDARETCDFGIPYPGLGLGLGLVIRVGLGLGLGNPKPNPGYYS